MVQSSSHIAGPPRGSIASRVGALLVLALAFGSAGVLAAPQPPRRPAPPKLAPSALRQMQVR